MLWRQGLRSGWKPGHRSTDVHERADVDSGGWARGMQAGRRPHPPVLSHQGRGHKETLGSGRPSRPPAQGPQREDPHWWPGFHQLTGTQKMCICKNRCPASALDPQNMSRSRAHSAAAKRSQESTRRGAFPQAPAHPADPPVLGPLCAEVQPQQEAGRSPDGKPAGRRERERERAPGTQRGRLRPHGTSQCRTPPATGRARPGPGQGAWSPKWPALGLENTPGQGNGFLPKAPSHTSRGDGGLRAGAENRGEELGP